MGNQQSFEKNTDFKDLKSNFTYQKKYSDSRFGEVKLIKENTTGRTLFQKDFTTSTAQEFQAYIKDIKDSSILQHPNILRVYGYNSKKEDLFCADFYKVSLFFESFDTDLEQEINKRRHTKEYFQETELWFILDSLASACAYLQISNSPHRDIRPFNVFINSNKDYKLSATNLFRQSYNPAYFDNFEGLEEQSHYHSPEILKHFSKSSEQRKTLSYDEQE
jgi:serine/threonine protein kinase